MKKSVPLWTVIVIVLIAVLVVVIFATQKPSAPPASGGAIVPSQTGGDGAVVPSQTGGDTTVAQITEEQAKEIALEKAGLTASDVRFERVEKDYENGILVYEIEFNKGRIEYSTEISASDGKIISWEIDAD